MASADLRLLLEVDETQVSRTGRRLLEGGLVTRGKVGPEHFMESLRLPPQDRAPQLFVRDTSRHERVHRLVETLFGAYERGAPARAPPR